MWGLELERHLGSLDRVRIGDAIESDAPYHLNLRKGSRAAVVVPLVLAFCELVLSNSGVALFAVFAATAALVFADYGGPPGPRARAYLTMLLLGAAMVLLGAGLSAHPVAAVAGMFAVAFGVTLASSLGEYAPLHVSPIALAYSLSVLEPLSDVSVADRLAGWTIGSLAAMLGALVLWPIVARTGMRPLRCAKPLPPRSLIRHVTPTATSRHSPSKPPSSRGVRPPA